MLLEDYRSLSFAKTRLHKDRVTPQLVDKFAIYSIKLNPRHPDRSEGSPELGSDLVNWRDGTTFRMTYLGRYKIDDDYQFFPWLFQLTFLYRTLVVR